MKKGFTLIELLVVVLIIGILAAVAVPQYQKAVEKSRAVEAMTLLEALGKAQTLYYLSNGVYSNDMSALDIQLPGVGSGFTKEIQTKNFKIQLSSSDGGNSFFAMATRITGSGALATGDLAYELGIMSNGKGQLNRICYEQGAGICKSLTGNRQCFDSDKDVDGWCYKD